MVVYEEAKEPYWTIKIEKINVNQMDYYLSS